MMVLYHPERREMFTIVLISVIGQEIVQGCLTRGVGKCHAVKMSEQHPSDRMLPTLAPTYCRCIVHQVTLSRFRVIFTLMGDRGEKREIRKKGFLLFSPSFLYLVGWKDGQFLERKGGFFQANIYLFRIFFLEKFLKIGVLLIFFPSIVGVVVT